MPVDFVVVPFVGDLHECALAESAAARRPGAI
jgi:hypothetical protein